jgi:precorrin-2 dehydrogenase/sirohydrochlorin ferrochelatase
MVARRKIESLLEYNAKVRVVSPRVEAIIEEWAAKGLITWQKRNFAADDLQDALLVFIATDNSDLNSQIAGLCRQKNIMVNAVDDPSNCDFYVPSVLRRKSLSLAISTAGKSPLFAARLRRELEDIVTDEYGDFVEMLGEFREQIKSSGLPIEDRKRLYTELVNSDILELLKIGAKEKVEERIKQCMSSWQA